MFITIYVLVILTPLMKLGIKTLNNMFKVTELMK
jgi:hypothetical protein